MWLEFDQLTEDFLPAVLDLDQRCLGGLWTLEGYRRELESPNSELLILKPSAVDRSTTAETTSRVQTPVLGFGCYWAILEEAHITILAVDFPYRRQGLGHCLLWALLSSAYRRKLERATLEVRISNQSARSLYKKFGFREAGCRRRYYQDTGEDALVLWRGGLQSPDFLQTLKALQQEGLERLSHSDWHLFLPECDGESEEFYLTC